MKRIALFLFILCASLPVEATDLKVVMVEDMPEQEIGETTLVMIPELQGNKKRSAPFGFKQIEISNGKYRPGTDDEKPWGGKWLSTPWNEIEVGIGLAVGMPILLVHDPIINEGVFDNGLSECFVARVLSTEDSRRLEYNRSFQEWYSKL